MLLREFNMNRTQFDLLFDALVMKEMQYIIVMSAEEWPG
jgi:hypothetical protein